MSHLSHTLSRLTVLWRSGAQLGAVLLMLGTLAHAAAAQQPQTGIITGRVLDGMTNTPLPSVQVFVGRIGTLTGEDGRFVLRGVPAGAQELKAQRIGHKSITRPITVPAGQSIEQNLTLEQQVLAMDELVVTGTAVQARRRELGNTIARIDAVKLAEKPVASVDHMLQNQSPGMSVTLGSGIIGGGSQIRLRGNVSASMSNQPLIYVDGLRFRSDGYPENRPTQSASSERAGGTASPIDDINPADIERIEIIKGPAATTLYGTEAAAGVIQIFTKRGGAGRPVWAAKITTGANWLGKFGPTSREFGAQGNVASDSTFNRYDGFLGMDPYLKTAIVQTYDLSVSGGTDASQYYLSGSVDNNEGMMPNDFQTKKRVRGNLNFTPFSKLSIQWSSSYSRDNTMNTPSGNNAFSLPVNVYRAPNNFIGGSKRIVDEVMRFKITNANSHFLMGATAIHTLTDRFQNKVTIGYDRADSHQMQIIPFGTVYLRNGSIFDKRWVSESTTAEYVGSFDLKITESIGSKFSWGGQSVQTHVGFLEGYGTNFPGPGDYTVSGAASKLTFAEDERVINAGFFVQDMISFGQRLFLTAGMRIDGNSAFGEDFGLQTYPKLSFSYVISDEAFWPESLGQFKVRGAYGHAGRAPGAFDAVRTWEPQQFGTRSAFIPRNLGAPDLGPERSSELELGFEGTVLNDRISLDFTHYQRKTSDALFSVTQIPSLGFLQNQLQNVGELKSNGIELQVNATLLDRESLRFELGGSIATHHSNVESLGGAAAFSIGSQGFIDVGQPVPGVRGWIIKDPTALVEPEFEVDAFFGPNQPTLIGTINSTLTLPLGIQFAARGEYQGGHYMFDNQARRSQISANTWPWCDRYREFNSSNRRAELTAQERALCDSRLARVDMFIWPADYFRLRDVSLQLPLGARIPRTTSSTLTLALRNVWTWTHADFLGIDPEMTGDGGLFDRTRNIGENIPTPRSFMASLRVVF